MNGPALSENGDAKPDIDCENIFLIRSDRTRPKVDKFWNFLYEWKACSKTFQMSTNVVG
jgi:hypothetical protein